MGSALLSLMVSRNDEAAAPGQMGPARGWLHARAGSSHAAAAA